MPDAAYRVAVILGSDSDLHTMLPCFNVLDTLQIPYTLRVLSAHRSPEAAAAFAASARGAGYRTLIAAAGKAAHLAGVLAAHTTLPVIGVPIKSSTLDGLDALLSTVQMPSGIPVATVAIDGAENAAYLAAQVLAVSDHALASRLQAARQAMTEAVLEKDRGIAARADALRQKETERTV